MFLRSGTHRWYTSGMSDMPKQQYLNRDDKGWKLRRNVPKELRPLAGKTAWVERVGGKTHAEACELARTFGVRTDLEISRLREASRNSVKEVAATTGSEAFDLSDSEIDQIAIAYFHEREKAKNDVGGHRAGVNADNREEILLILGEDHIVADAIAIGDNETAKLPLQQDASALTHLTALRELIRYGFIEKSDVEEQYQETRKGRGRSLSTLRVSDELRSNPRFQKLSDKLATANAELARRAFEAVSQDRHPTLQNQFFEPALNPHALLTPRKERRVGELIERYLADRKEEVGTSRFNQLQIATRALKEEVGTNSPLNSVTREQCESLARLFINIPAYATRHYEKMTLREAAKAHESKEGSPAQRFGEASKNLAVLREIFEFALDKEWLDRNPVERVKISKPARPERYSDGENGYEPFTIEELQIIFSQPLYTGCKDDGNGVNRVGPNHPRRSRFWLPLVSLFSGMRAQEILQLERTDIQRADGIFSITVTDRIHGSYPDGEYTKRLKAKNSVRCIPVHRELERLGFLEYVTNCKDERLFPDVALGKASKMSDQFTKKFKTFMKPTGVSVPRRKVFHSFRNTFNDGLRAADVHIEIREQIMGWVDYSRMDSRYGKGHLIQKLKQDVDKVKFDGLDLSHLYRD